MAEEKVRTHSPFVFGRKVVIRHRPLGVVGVIAHALGGPVEPRAAALLVALELAPLLRPRTG